MKIDWYTRLILTIIAIGLFLIAFERSSPQVAVAAEAASSETIAGLRDAEFVPTGNSRFIMISRRTGDFSMYELTPSNNKWKWQKFGPTGNLISLGAAPTTAPQPGN